MNPQQSSSESPDAVEVIPKSKQELKRALGYIENLYSEMEKRVGRGTQVGNGGDEGDIWANCASAVITHLEAARLADQGELGDAKLYFSKWEFELQQKIKAIKQVEEKGEKEKQEMELRGLIDKIKAKIDEVLA